MSKKEKCIPKFPGIYRVFEVDESGKEIPTNVFRVRKRAKVNARWTTRVMTFASFEEAKHFARQPLSIDRFENTPSLFEEVLEKFFHHKEHEELRAKGTVNGYRSRAQHFKFFHGLEMKQVQPKVIDAWANLLLDPEYKDANQSTRESYEHELVLLSVIFNYYREFHDETYVLPIMKRHRKRLCSKPKNAQRIRYLSAAEEIRFLEALQMWPTIRDIALFQLHTGARIGEAAAMEFDAIEFDQQQVHIRQHLHWERSKNGKIEVLKGTKTGADRTVPLTSECLEMLRERRRGRTSNVIFEDSKKGGWLAYRTIQNVYDTVLKRIGLTLTGSHILRHTFAVRFLEQTKDIYALQKALGHTDLETTLIYAKYTNASVKRAFQMFRGGGENEVGSSKFVPNVVS